MDLDALMRCVGTTSCIVTQLTSGMIIGMLLFLIASGVTLIFGVLNVINFAHGSLYMIGAYAAWTFYQLTGSYFISAFGAAVAVGILGIAFERFLMSKVYGSNVLMQLLVCYAVVLISDDLIKIIWGPVSLSMGMPVEFRLPPLRFFGGVVPPFYIFMIVAAMAIGLLLWLVIARTRFGNIVRAAAVNGPMVSALGIRVNLYYAAVFGIGSALAGAAGALAAPVRSLTPGMGFSILIESFIVTVIGGMGSIVGAFVASIIIGLTRSFGSIGFPLFVDGVMFLIMALVLIFKPSGLFGRPHNR
ncbi:MAG: branched-chain amino acid ABC transporter permease [Reyranella sp.]|nr:branched-chain amino acid ABC transporter permease [Reyranella sp.]MBN9538362.1 branched-chain amino acid ABC transporter permease [Alphaproteobacteria bacterium]MBR2815311.1 branched-chain amino acid ABC transporter permease [Reyranella sp.]OJU34077.1 MAG: branched-chain amino acid ABC transporter permease [Alphaproteobacteria bacterium 65-37]